MTFIPADLVVGNTRALAQSALPNAPVQPEPEPRRGLDLRSRLGTALRATAARELRWADRVDPHCEPTPT